MIYSFEREQHLLNLTDFVTFHFFFFFFFSLLLLLLFFFSFSFFFFFSNLYIFVIFSTKMVGISVFLELKYERVCARARVCVCLYVCEFDYEFCSGIVLVVICARSWSAS